LLQPRPRYGDFSISQDGGRRHVGFLKFQILNREKVTGNRNMNAHFVRPVAVNIAKHSYQAIVRQPEI